jgi:hypothetical protein
VRGARSPRARGALAAAGGIWSLLAGASGLILAALWLFTDHTAAYRNENLFQFSPLSLLLAVLVPLSVLGRGRQVRLAQGVAATIVGLAVAGILFKLVPGTRQVNAMLIALALPGHTGLWLGLRALRPLRPVAAPLSAPTERAASESPTA